MALKKCKECGNDVSSKGKKCPHCGAPIKKKTNIGCLILLTVFNAFLFILIFGALITEFGNGTDNEQPIVTENKEFDRAKEVFRENVQKKIYEEKWKELEVFSKTIEQHYQKLLSFYNSKKIRQASEELDLFKKYKRLDYKNVNNISKDITISRLEKEVRPIPAYKVSENLRIYQQLLELDPTNEKYKQKVSYYKAKAEERKQVKPKKQESCYSLGYRYGLCATKSLHGVSCKPENDIIMPERCRGKSETKRGIKAGAKAVYDTLNLDKGSSYSSSTLNMLITPLDVLKKELKGKTKSEVRRLVGSPDRIEVFAGKKCWIYGNTYTSKDRGIVFDGESVMTVTFY